MLILALDTCLGQCAACLYDASARKVLAQSAEIMERGHAEALAPMVQKVLGDLKPDRIAVTTGPGTFTGLRIGLSFARAYGLALDIPVIGLDTMQALRLSQESKKNIALASGQSGLAFVLNEKVSDISLVPLADIAPENLVTDNVNLQRLAIWAEKQIPGPMPEPVYIRQADAKPAAIIKDVDAKAAETLAHIHSQSFSKTWTVQDFTDLLSVNGTTALVAEVASQPAAILVYRTILGETEIITIATTPERRKLGLAAKLLSQMTSPKQFLEVSALNRPAIKLYAKNGFVEISRRKAYYADGDDAIIMQRLIT